MKQVLLIEDDRRLAEHIGGLIHAEGIAVQHASSISELVDYINSGENFSAIILDRMMGGSDTKSKVSDLKRRWPNAPICVLSAINTPLERAELLDLGVDDYVGKPFFSSELLARLRALMRRPRAAPSSYVEIGDLILDVSRRLLLKGDQQQILTGKEFLLMKLLSDEVGRVFSKVQLLEMVWSSSLEVETNVVEATMTNLRKRIQQLNSTVQIKNMRNAGYWLES